MKIIDSHVHVSSTVNRQAPLYAMAERLGYHKLAVMSLQCTNPLQNTIGALCKLQHPNNTYAFGGLDYITGRDFKTQAENMRAMGYDGIKMLEGKPTTRRLLNMPLDDVAYDPYYAYMEETGFPIVMHVVDPDTFWDPARAPGFAVEHGWTYNETDVPYEQYYVEVENMLRKHPKLRIVFAHFFFLSWNAARAQQFLDAHPNVSFDITAGIEMYENFTLDPGFWRAFFIKNQDRIIYGTDSTDQEPDGEQLSINGYAGMEIEFLTHNKPVEIYGMKLHGMGLPEDTCRRIFADNFIRLAGDTPKPMDKDALRQEALLVRQYLKGDAQVETMDAMIAQL